MIFPAHLVKSFVIQKIDVNKSLVFKGFLITGCHRISRKYTFILCASARHIIDITFSGDIEHLIHIV